MDWNEKLKRKEGDMEMEVEFRTKEEMGLPDVAIPRPKPIEELSLGAEFRATNKRLFVFLGLWGGDAIALGSDGESRIWGSRFVVSPTGRRFTKMILEEGDGDE